MTTAELVDARQKYLMMADKPCHPGVAKRLRKLAADCLLLAADPADEALTQQYIASARDFDAYVNHTGRYTLEGPVDPQLIQEELATIREAV